MTNPAAEDSRAFYDARPYPPPGVAAALINRARTDRALVFLADPAALRMFEAGDGSTPFGAIEGATLELARRRWWHDLLLIGTTSSGDPRACNSRGNRRGTALLEPDAASGDTGVYLSSTLLCVENGAVAFCADGVTARS